MGEGGPKKTDKRNKISCFVTVTGGGAKNPNILRTSYMEGPSREFVMTVRLTSGIVRSGRVSGRIVRHVSDLGRLRHQRGSLHALQRRDVERVQPLPLVGVANLFEKFRLINFSNFNINYQLALAWPLLFIPSVLLPCTPEFHAETQHSGTEHYCTGCPICSWTGLG